MACVFMKSARIHINFNINVINWKTDQTSYLTVLAVLWLEWETMWHSLPVGVCHTMWHSLPVGVCHTVRNSLPVGVCHCSLEINYQIGVHVQPPRGGGRVRSNVPQCSIAGDTNANSIKRVCVLTIHSLQQWK